MHKYLDNEEATKEVVYDGWFNSGDIGYQDKDGYVYVNSGNVYDFTLNELQNYESYLKTSAGYKGKVTLYAKISCKYIYYGTEKEAQSIAQINICQRQFFDLDWDKNFITPNSESLRLVQYSYSSPGLLASDNFTKMPWNHQRSMLV